VLHYVYIVQYRLRALHNLADVRCFKRLCRHVVAFFRLYYNNKSTLTPPPPAPHEQLSGLLYNRRYTHTAPFCGLTSLVYIYIGTYIIYIEFLTIQNIIRERIGPTTLHCLSNDYYYYRYYLNTLMII